MMPRDWFSVGIRLYGVWLMIRVLEYALSFAYVQMGGNPADRFDSDAYTTAQAPFYLCYMFGYGAVGAYLLLGADHLTRISFREGRCRESGTNSEDKED
jgi:hypothetical protein